MLIWRFFGRIIREGRLTVIDASGQSHTFQGVKPGRSITVRLHDRKVERDILLNPMLGVPEAYVDGRLTIEEGDLYGFLEMAIDMPSSTMPRSCCGGCTS
jgi:cyclopropane-fatty-acyl-phospholipid synthase